MQFFKLNKIKNLKKSRYQKLEILRRNQFDKLENKNEKFKSKM